MVRAAPAAAAAAAADSSSESSCDEGSDHEQEVALAVADGEKFPLAHRVLTSDEFGHAAQLESVLRGPQDYSTLLQKGDMGLSEAWRLGLALVQESSAPKLWVVTGDEKHEEWKQMAATNLVGFASTFRRILVTELSARFNFNGVPNKHVLLALRLDPSVDTTAESELLKSKPSFLELMDAEVRQPAALPATPRPHRVVSACTAHRPATRGLPHPLRGAVHVGP